MNIQHGFYCGFCLLAAALVAGCATTTQAPQQAEITDEVVAEVAILDVDKANRELTFERRDGSRVVVIAGPEVRNFDQIEPGDTLTVRYVMTLMARRLGDEPDTVASVTVAGARAESGQRPAGAIGASMSMTVLIRSVDVDNHLVTFNDPDGVVHVVEAEREVGRRFIAGLKPGDRVELTFVKALGLAVQ